MKTFIELDHFCYMSLRVFLLSEYLIEPIDYDWRMYRFVHSPRLCENDQRFCLINGIIIDETLLLLGPSDTGSIQSNHCSCTSIEINVSDWSTFWQSKSHHRLDLFRNISSTAISAFVHLWIVHLRGELFSHTALYQSATLSSSITSSRNTSGKSKQRIKNWIPSR